MKPYETIMPQHLSGTIACITGFLVIMVVATIANAASPERISVEDAYNALLAGEKVSFIDTRNEGEWQGATTMLPGAFRVYTQEDLQRVMNRLPKERLIIPYCT